MKSASVLDGLVAKIDETAKQNLPPSARDPEVLRLMDEASGRWDGHLYEIRSEAFTQVLWAHGFQNYAFSKTAQSAVDLRDFGYSNATPMNVLLPIVQLQKALLLARTPKRETYATTRDEADIEAARWALDYLSWEDEFLRIKELRDKAATTLAETGNVIAFVGWDPAGGRMWVDQDGTPIFEGDPIVRIDTMFDWNFHPDAEDYRQSPYAFRRSFVSRDWAYDHFPEYAAAMPAGSTLTSDAVPVFQRRLLNLSPSGTTRTYVDRRAPKNDEFFEFGELYYRDSLRRPLGLAAFCFCVGGQPVLATHVGPNPYKERATGRCTLPVVHAKQISRTGAFWGESILQHALSMQNYINCFEDVIAENAEMIGNPKGYFFQDGVNPASIDNEVATWIPCAPGSQPPGFIPVPELPKMLMEGPTRAIQYLDRLAQPIGPLQQEAESNITSGVQQAIVNEGKQFRVGPLMASWEGFWDAVTVLRLDNVANFMTIPRKIGVVGHDGGWRQTYFSGQLASGNFVVRVVEGSSMPLSQSARTAWWIEMFKTPPVQLFTQTNPGAVLKKFFDDIGHGDLARTLKDPDVHIDKARRNIMDVRLGIPRVANPMVDSIPDHVAVYQTFMASPEYDDAVRQDPTLEIRMTALLQSFIQLQWNMMQLVQAQQQAPAGGPGMPGGPAAQGGVGATHGGDGGAPRATQGFGRGPSGARNNGGRPEGS